MSVEKQEVQTLSFLEQLKFQHANFIQQRDFAQNNLNQLIGAVFASEIMIKKYEEEAKNLEAVKDNVPNESKETDNGEADNQDQEQAA